MDEEVDTSFTHQYVSVQTRLRLLSNTFRKQSGNQNIEMLVIMCQFSNQLIPLPINDYIAVSGGNGLSVPDS